MDIVINILVILEVIGLFIGVMGIFTGMAFGMAYLIIKLMRLD